MSSIGEQGQRNENRKLVEMAVDLTQSWIENAAQYSEGDAAVKEISAVLEGIYKAISTLT